MHIGSLDYLKEKYDIDVGVPESFDLKKGYMSVVDTHGIVYIKLHMGNIKDWGCMLSMELRTEIRMVKSNETKKKCIGELYKIFVERYRLPKNYKKIVEESVKYYEGKDWEYKKELGEEVEGYSKKEYELYMDIAKENAKNESMSYSYEDEGCVCIACEKRREEVKCELLKNGECDVSIHHEKEVYKSKMINRKRWIEKLKEQQSKKKGKKVLVL